MAEENVVIEMKNIYKSFPGVKALSSVNFKLLGGEIHALMGENGAGKSTLIKVLTGVYNIDNGEMLLNGKLISPKSPLEAQNIGISTVYQEVNLCLNLTVAENIFIGRQPMKKGRIDWEEMNKKAELVLLRLNLKVDVKKLLSSYSVAIQQMIAIGRAVDISAGVLILDEPTSSLDNNEVKELFKVMNKLKNEGIAIIFVTHFLDQVYEIADRITVLRNGKLIGTYSARELSKIDLVTKMIGKELVEFKRISSDEVKVLVEEVKDVLIETKGLSKLGTIEPFNMELRKGEILGLAGLLGSGRTEIANLLFGISKADKGVITVNNKVFSSMYPKKAIEEGMGFCPENRKVEGIIGELTIRENIVLALQASNGYFKYMTMKKQQEVAKKYIDILSIATPSMEQRVDNLSGGNQQKVILARWLATEPKILILDEPTRGIDVGSKAEIQKLIITLAKTGMTILFISSELEEIVRCCSRVLVLRDKNIIAELKDDKIDVDIIMQTIAEGGRINGKVS